MARPPTQHTVEQQVGARIAGLRAAKGLTQEELAEMMGVGVQLVGRAERGTLKLRVERVLQFAAGLGVTGAALLPDQEGDTGDGITPDERELIRKWRSVRSDLRPLLIRVVSDFVAASE